MDRPVSAPTRTGLRRSAPVLALAATAGLLTGCSGNGPATVAQGVLTVCTDAPFAPFETEQDGQYTGYDVDLVHRIAADLGLDTRVVETSFADIESGAALDGGRCDLAAAGIPVTAARSEKVDFSVPYHHNRLALAVDEKAGTTGLGDVTDDLVGVQADSLAEYLLTDRGFDTEPFTDPESMFAALDSGKVHAVADYDAVVGHFLADRPGLRMVDRAESTEDLAVAVKKGNTDLLEKVDETLQRMKDDGSADDLARTWFGPAADS